jgi:HEPN domain-containing protein
MVLGDVCKNWIQSANNDFIVINSILMQVQNPRLRPHELVLYHCQQATEKMLKAFLTYNGISPWGHDLNTLRTSCASFDAGFDSKRISDHCAFLTAFNTARYPDFTDTIDASTASRGLNSAKRVYDFVSEKLGQGKAFFL